MQSAKTRTKQHTRDAEATKTSILDAAETEFARAGLLGARTENIAAATGVTRGMIHYYYDSKEKLYEEVLARAFSGRIRRVQDLDLNEPDTVVLLEKYIREFMDEQIINVNLANILLFEAIQNDGRFYKEVAVVAIYGPLLTIIERGIKEGRFATSDARHATINIIGTCMFYLCARNNLKHLFPEGTDLLEPSMISQHIEEAVRLVIHGLVIDRSGR